MRLAARCVVAGIAAVLLSPGIGHAAADPPKTPLDVIADGFQAGGQMATGIADGLSGSGSQQQSDGSSTGE